MQVAVISDIHDQLDVLKVVIEDLNAMEISHVIFCGDFCSPIPARLLCETFNGQVHAVFGNTEDRDATPALVGKYDNFHHYGDLAEFELDGKKIAVVHYPDKAEDLLHSGKYDFVFSGHTHQHMQAEFGLSVWVNPGDMLGFKEAPHYALVDLQTKKVDFITVT